MADVYEEGYDDHSFADIKMRIKKEKLNITKDQSPAAFCARTGKLINVKDMTTDSRFSSENRKKSKQDQESLTSAETLANSQSSEFSTIRKPFSRNILCIPIMGTSNVMGVYQVVNKLGGIYFTRADERILETFSVYISLYLYCIETNKMLKTTSQLNTIFSRLIEFYSKPHPIDMERFHSKLTLDQMPLNFYTFEWYITPEYEIYMPQLCLKMISEIVGYSNINIGKMMEKILVIQKSYRPHPYHNFEHGFATCHCMYLILNKTMDYFTLLEREALMIAALGHDIDHPGFTNYFLRLINDPIAKLYEESSMQNHKANLLIKLLGDMTLFTNITSSQYKEFTNELKSAIVSTEIRVHIKNRSKLKKLLKENKFDWHNPNDRKIVKSVVMASADFSVCLKPYTIAKKWIENILREYYNQGDLEKQMHLTPFITMDRDKAEWILDLPEKLIQMIALPCFQALASVLPNLSELVDRSRDLCDQIVEAIPYHEKLYGIRDEEEEEALDE